VQDLQLLASLPTSLEVLRLGYPGFVQVPAALLLKLQRFWTLQFVWRATAFPAYAGSASWS